MFLFTKSQLIPKRPFGVIIWTKITMKKFDNFCPNQQNKGTFLLNTIIYLLLYGPFIVSKTLWSTFILWFDNFSDSRVEIFKNFHWYFGPNYDTNRTFWNNWPLKFIYSEKATKFSKISTNYLSYVLSVK